MMYKLNFTLALVWLGLLCACTSPQANKQPVLKHVVAFQFKPEVSPQRQAQAIKDFLHLKEEISEIRSFEGGEDISVEGFDQGFSHCFVLTFKDEAARDAYLPHPAHLALVDKNKPLMSDLLVLDFRGME